MCALLHISSDISSMIYFHLDIKDVLSISRTNTYLNNLIQKYDILARLFCKKYKLINIHTGYSKDNEFGKFISGKLFNYYKFIIENAVCCSQAHGAWQNNNSDYWLLDHNDINEQYSWFPEIKKCDYVWWYEIKIEKTLHKAGIYDIWIRIKYDQTLDSYNTHRSYGIQCTTQKKIINKRLTHDTLIKLQNKWADIKLCCIDINDNENVIVKIYNYGKLLHKNHYYAFLYFVPCLNTNTTNNELIDFGQDVIIL